MITKFPTKMSLLVLDEPTVPNERVYCKESMVKLLNDPDAPDEVLGEYGQPEPHSVDRIQVVDLEKVCVKINNLRIETIDESVTLVGDVTPFGPFKESVTQNFKDNEVKLFSRTLVVNSRYVKEVKRIIAFDVHCTDQVSVEEF